jgi:hypothetical protein
MELEERIVSLYLLLASFHDEGAESHPFVMSILFISATTEEPLERTMIYDVLIRGNKNKVPPPPRSTVLTCWRTSSRCRLAPAS